MIHGFHAIGNTTGALRPPYYATEIGPQVYFGLLLIAAVIVVLLWGWRTLNRGQAVPRPSLPDNGCGYGYACA